MSLVSLVSLSLVIRFLKNIFLKNIGRAKRLTKLTKLTFWDLSSNQTAKNEVTDMSTAHQTAPPEAVKDKKTFLEWLLYLGYSEWNRAKGGTDMDFHIFQEHLRRDLPSVLRERMSRAGNA